MPSTPSLKDLGINHNQSQRWQQIANELGVHRNTVAADLCTKNSVITEKVVHKQPRSRFKQKSPPGCLNLPTNNSRLS